MINIEDNLDQFGRRKITVDQTREDRKSHFLVKLLTADLSMQFLAAPGRQIIDLKVIDLDEDNVHLEPNSIIIPLVLSSMTRVDDITKCYYRQKFDNNKSNLGTNADAECYVIWDKGEIGETQALVSPHLLLTFSIAEQNLNTDRQQFSGQGLEVGYDRNLPPREHVDRGENANGGLNLPLGEQKSDTAEQERLQKETQPEPAGVLSST